MSREQKLQPGQCGGLDTHDGFFRRIHPNVSCVAAEHDDDWRFVDAAQRIRNTLFDF